MIHVSRRQFMLSATAGAFLVAVGNARGAQAVRLGSQSYSFRNFDTLGAIAQLQALGLSEMEFCGVHFPADHNDPKFKAAQEAIAAAGIKVPVYGVEAFSADEAANRKKFEFGKALGIEILTADPAPDSFDSLEKLTEEFGIKIAIHNHGPGARYDGVSDTLKAVEGRSKLIGACLDTGHCIRSGEKPHEVIEQLGDRLISLHLKDWKHGGEEQIVGKGDLDVVKVAAALEAIGFDGPNMLEYEEQPENPAPDMKIGVANWREAVAKAQAPATT
jgi:sugar phosphate isomerase/epimerase